MKRILIYTLALGTVPVSAGTISLTQTKPSGLLKHSDTPFGHFFSTPYSSMFGLQLYVTKGSRLHHRITLSEEAVTDTLQPDQKAALEKGMTTLEQLAKANNVLWIKNYQDMGLNHTLHIQGDGHGSSEVGTGSAVLLRVREKFQFLNEEVGAANFNYLDDAESGSTGSQFSAAAMVDIYPHLTYNRCSECFRENKRDFIIQNKFRYWFRVGAEYEFNELEPGNEVDGGSAYALINFQANPDQDADFLGLPWFSITSPQFVQLGAAYDWNSLTGEEDLRYVIGWQPRFILNKQRGFLGRGLALGSRMYYEKGKFASLFQGGDSQDAASKEPEQISEIFSFILPYLALEGPSAARTGSFEVDLPDVSDNESLKDFQNEVLRYNLKLGLGFFDGGAIISYTFNGVHPLADLGKSRTWHEVKAEFSPWHILGDRHDKGDKNTAVFSIYASYLYGEPENHALKVDQFRVGAQLRF